MQNGKSICCEQPTGTGATGPASIASSSAEHEPTSLEPVSEFVLRPTVTSMVLDRQRPHVNTLVQKMKQITRFFHNRHAVSGFVQFWVLFRLMWTKIIRNRTVLWIQLIHHVACGVFVGRTAMVA